MAHRTTESAAAAGRARWAGTTREERVEGMKAPTQARVSAADIDAKFDLLGTVLLDRLDALQAEVAALRRERAERIAA